MDTVQKDGYCTNATAEAVVQNDCDNPDSKVYSLKELFKPAQFELR